MPRKKRPTAETTRTETGTATADAESTAPDTEEQSRPEGGEPGNPDKAIVVSKEKRFAMGENRLFKPRVLIFREKPDEQTLAALKEDGFTCYDNEESADRGLWIFFSSALTIH
jgi:hypothetical protein